MSFRTVGQRLVEILEDAIGGSPDLNAADGSDTIRRDLTASEVSYGPLVFKQPFPNLWIEWTGAGFEYVMAAGERQTRQQRYNIWIVSLVSGAEPKTGADTETQIANAEQDIQILTQNIIKVLMAEIQDTSSEREWYLLSFGDLEVSDEASEAGVWCKVGKLPVSLELEYSTT